MRLPSPPNTQSHLMPEPMWLQDFGTASLQNNPLPPQIATRIFVGKVMKNWTPQCAQRAQLYLQLAFTEQADFTNNGPTLISNCGSKFYHKAQTQDCQLSLAWIPVLPAQSGLNSSLGSRNPHNVIGNWWLGHYQQMALCIWNTQQSTYKFQNQQLSPNTQGSKPKIASKIGSNFFFKLLFSRNQKEPQMHYHQVMLSLTCSTIPST